MIDATSNPDRITYELGKATVMYSRKSKRIIAIGDNGSISDLQQAVNAMANYLKSNGLGT